MRKSRVRITILPKLTPQDPTAAYPPYQKSLGPPTSIGPLTPQGFAKPVRRIPLGSFWKFSSHVHTEVQNQAQIENLHKFPIRQHPRPWPPLQFGRFPLGNMGPFGSFAAGPRIFSEGTDFTIRVIPPPQPFSGPNPKKCQIQEMSFPCRPLLRFLFICSL
jgi:hypothetical protein